MALWDKFLQKLISPIVNESIKELSKEGTQDKKVEKALAVLAPKWRYSPTDTKSGVARKDTIISWSRLRDFSVHYPILRACLSYRKRQITQLAWSVSPREVIADKAKKKKYEEDAKKVRDFLKYPLGDKTVTLREFVGKILEDLLVLDAVAIYRRRNKIGEPYGFLPIDATTIELILNKDGTIPLSPKPAYQQKIKGEVVGKYTIDEMIYKMLNPRTNTPFGLSPVESLVLTITTALKLSSYQFSYLSEGNVPEGFVELPKDIASSPDQLKIWQEAWDAIFSGNPKYQRKIKFLPEGMKWIPIKKPEDMEYKRFEEWLLLNTASLMEVPPQAIGFQFERGKGATEAEWEIGKERGLFPTANFLKELFDGIVQDDLGQDHLEFVWTNINPTNKAEEAKVFQTLVNTGAVSVDEWRLGEGLDTIGLDHYIMTPIGPIATKKFIEMTESGEALIPESYNPNQPRGKPTEAKKPTEVKIAKRVKAISREETTNELKKWKRAAANDLKKGQGFRNFQTEIIDFRSQQLIKNGLKSVKTRVDLDQLFAPFISRENKVVSAVLDLYDDVTKITETSKTKKAIERFFYKARFNIALHQALHKKPYYKVRDKFESAIKKQILHFAKVEKINEIVGIEKAKKKGKYLPKVIALWILVSEFIKEDGLIDYLVTAANLGGQAGLGKLDSALEFDLKNKEIINSIKERVPELFSMIDRTTQSWIAETIQEGINNKLSSFEMAKLLRDSAQEVAERRAAGIAENETALIMGKTELAVYEKNGIMYKKWIVVGDELTCILGSNAKVFIIGGKKKIKDIVVGDYVLTHKDRYCKVTGTFKRKYYDGVVRITLAKLNGKQNAIRLTVTDDHPILVKRYSKKVWVKASNLKKKDSVYILGRKCGCGKTISFFAKKCLSCWSTETNNRRWSDPKQKEKLAYFNRKYNKSRKMMVAQRIDRKKNPQKYKEAMVMASKTKKLRWENDKEFRKKRTKINQKTAKYLNHPFNVINRDPIKRARVLKMAHQALGRNHLGKSYLEKKMEWFLREERVDFIPQWLYKYNGKRAWADFYLPAVRTVIECDGYFHTLKETKLKDKEKDKWLTENGYNVLRFVEEEIRNNFSEVASVIKSLNCILPVKIKRLKRWDLKEKLKKWFQVVYNLEVEKDNSYIVNGVVVHNCNICWANEEAGEIPIDEAFPDGSMTVPSHNRCRCLLLPVIPDSLEVKWTGK